MHAHSILIASPNRSENAQAAGLLTSNGYDVECAETIFGAALRLKEQRKTYSLFICSSTLSDGPALPLVANAWDRWGVPTLQMFHHFPIEPNRREEEVSEIPEEYFMGRIDVPCSDEQFLEAVALTLIHRAPDQDHTNQAEKLSCAVRVEHSSDVLRSVPVRFAMILFTVEEMMERGNLPSEEWNKTVWAFLRDALGDSPIMPEEFSDILKRLTWIKDERELRRGMRHAALRAPGLPYEHLL